MPDTVSLTKPLVGLDGKNLKLGEGDEERDFDVRSAIMLAILQGSTVAQNKDKLSDVEKLNSYKLAKKISNEENTGCSLKSEEVTMIKKFANFRFGTEVYGALLEHIDPAEVEIEDAAKPS